MKLARHIAAVIFVAASAGVVAAPVSYSFNVQASEGSAFGGFSGDDLDMDGFMSAGEILSFMATATGTGFTGGPIMIDAAEALVNSFTFNIAGLSLTGFNVTNGLPNFAAGSEWMVLNGSDFEVGLNNRGSTRAVLSVSVRAVPEPGSLALLAIGLMAAGLSSRSARRS